MRLNHVISEVDIVNESETITIEIIWTLRTLKLTRQNFFHFSNLFRTFLRVSASLFFAKRKWNWNVE